MSQGGKLRMVNCTVDDTGNRAREIQSNISNTFGQIESLDPESPEAAAISEHIRIAVDSYRVEGIVELNQCD